MNVPSAHVNFPIGPLILKYVCKIRRNGNIKNLVVSVTPSRKNFSSPSFLLTDSDQIEIIITASPTIPFTSNPLNTLQKREPTGSLFIFVNPIASRTNRSLNIFRSSVPGNISRSPASLNMFSINLSRPPNRFFLFSMFLEGSHRLASFHTDMNYMSSIRKFFYI